MYRKVQQVGGSTYQVSLPKSWIGKFGIKKGDEVLVKEEEGSILILPQGEKEKKGIEIDADREIVPRSITTAYLSGFNFISIKSKGRISRNDKNEIKKVLRRFIGMEIVDESSNTVVIQDLLSPKDLDVMKGIRRAYKIASSMHLDAIKSLSENDHDLAEEVIQRDDEVDRIYFLAIRQLKSALTDPSYGITSEKCMDLRLLVKSIETLADASCNIARKKMKIKKEVDLVALSNECYKVHEGAFAAFLNSDTKKAQSLRGKIIEISGKKEKLYKEEIAGILDALENIAGSGVDIADLVV